MAEIELLDPATQQTTDLPVVAADSQSPQGEPCPSCGCPIEASDRFCPACGARRAVETAAESGEAAAPSRHFRCTACGAEMAADPDQRSYVCPFCDANYVVEFSPELTNREPPEFVIGFAVTREQAQEKFRQWIQQKNWFRPSDLVQSYLADKQKGVYLPFWAFTMRADSRWSASIGEHWYRTETYTERDSKGNVVTRTRQVQETEWWPLNGRHHSYYSGYLVSASRGLPQSVAQRIMPFNLPALKRYQAWFLAGWLSEEYSVAKEAALQLCQSEFQRRENSRVAAFLPGDTYRSLDVATQFSQINSDLCLLPVYILSYRYRDKLYRFLVNGQTGRCAGDKPLSWRKILLVIALGIAAVATVAGLIAWLNSR